MILFYQKHFAIIALSITLLFVGLATIFAKKVITNHQVSVLAIKLLKSIMLWGSIPWISLAIAMKIGDIHYFVYILSTRPLNPWIILFQLSIISVWLKVIHWIYVKNGINHLQIVLEYLTGRDVSEQVLKTLIMLCICGGITGMIMSYFIYIPREQMEMIMESMM